MRSVFFLGVGGGGDLQIFLGVLVKERCISEFPGGPAVKDSAWSLIWFRFHPWPENVYMPWRSKKGTRNRKKKRKKKDLSLLPL